MQDFPAELWAQIGAYLPDTALYRMLSVNRTLYQLSMDVRYGEVGVYEWNKKAKHLLSRIQDPMVGKHVRRFRLILLHETLPNTQSSPFRHPRKHIPTRTSKNGFPVLLEGLSAAFTSMPNIDHMYLRVGEVIPEYEDSMQMFFEHMWASLGRGLKSLKLFATICSFQLFIPPPSMVDFPLLRKLDMHFWDERFFMPNDTPDEGILSGTISPFLNSLAPQLHSLSISTYVFAREHHDVTSLFRYLTTFPLLDSLAIHLNSTRAEGKNEIRGFIEKHISHLTALRLDVRCWQDETLLSALLSGCLPPPPSSSTTVHSQGQQLQLKSLDLYSYSFTLCLDSLLSVIDRSDNTLESVSLESALSKPEVQTTIKALSACPNLSVLTLHLPGIDIDLFDLLYAKLPFIRKLTLRYNEIGLEVNPISKQVITLQRALRKRAYPHWALEDLSVFYDWKALNTGTMRSLARAIPSLRSFWGKGDMHTTPCGERWRDGWIWVLAGPWILKRGIITGIRKWLAEE